MSDQYYWNRRAVAAAREQAALKAEEGDAETAALFKAKADEMEALIPKESRGRPVTPPVEDGGA